MKVSEAMAEIAYLAIGLARGLCQLDQVVNKPCDLQRCIAAVRISPMLIQKLSQGNGEAMASGFTTAAKTSDEPSQNFGKLFR